MNISKKYIKESFKLRGMQINKKALDMIEERIKMHADHYARMCKEREFKRVNPLRVERIFKYEDSL